MRCEILQEMRCYDIGIVNLQTLFHLEGLWVLHVVVHVYAHCGYINHRAQSGVVVLTTFICN
jgi:hypothetical protein